MDLSKLTTENRNQASLGIDEMSALEIVEVINSEDKKVATAIEKVSAEIAEAIEKIAQRFNEGGRIIYIGAGTSGRLGALDAIELTPTYSVPAERAFGIMAGGEAAMFTAVEGAEDSQELAVTDLKKINLQPRDSVIGLAASGRTPYTVAAINYANEVGALTVSVTCNDRSQMNELAQIGVAPLVGPEVITGSTRMKAGTAQKMVLNMISTGVMVKVGKIYQNLMVNVQPTNQKLVQRAINIIHDGTGASYEQAADYLVQAENDVAVAIVMIKTDISAIDAKKLLIKHKGQVSKVIAIIQHA